MDELINVPILKSLISDIVNSKFKDMQEKDLTGETWDIDQFRKECCGNRGREWVRCFIFDEFPEMDQKNGGFVVNPRKTKAGSKTIIFAKRAKQWMEQHQDDIDWNASFRKL